MDKDINNKKYILHYKAYGDKILYFRNKFPTINNCCNVVRVDVKNEDTNPNNSKLYFSRPTGKSGGYIYTNWGFDVENSNIEEQDDFTIYFRIQLDPPTTSQYNILSEGQIFVKSMAYSASYHIRSLATLYYSSIDKESDLIKNRSFMLFIKDYRLHLHKGVNSTSLCNTTDAIITKNYRDTYSQFFINIFSTSVIDDLKDGTKLHHIALTRHAGIIRVYVNGKKIYESPQKIETALFFPSGGEGKAFQINDDKTLNRDANGVALLSETEIDPRGDIWADILVGDTGNQPFYLNDLVVCKGFAFYRYFDFNPIPDDIVDPDPTYYKVLINVPNKNNRNAGTDLRYRGDFKFDTHIEYHGNFEFSTEYHSNIGCTRTQQVIRKVILQNVQYNFSTKYKLLINVEYHDPLKRVFVYKDQEYSFLTRRNVLKNEYPEFDTNYTLLLNNDNTHPKSNTKRKVLYNIKDIDIPNSKDMRNPTKYQCLVEVLKGGLKSNTKRKVLINIKNYNNDTKLKIVCTNKPFFDTYYKLLISKLDPNDPLLKGDLSRRLEETWELLTPTKLMALLIRYRDTKRLHLKKIQVKFRTKRYLKTSNKPFVNFVYNTKIQLWN